VGDIRRAARKTTSAGKGLVAGGADLLLVETCQDTGTSRRHCWRLSGCRGRSAANTGDRFGDDRADGDDARGTDRGGDVGITAACQAAGVRDELRDRAGVHDGPHSNAKFDDRTICFVLPERGLPDEEGKYLETPTSLAAQLKSLLTMDG